MNKIFLLMCSLGLVACSGPNEDLQNWMQNVRQHSATQKIKPTQSNLVLQSDYTPPPQPAMNAFDPARLKMGAHGRNAPNLNRPKQILENFSLDSLHYVGQISSHNQPTSAFIEVDGHVYTAYVGNYIGQDYGRIVAITPNEIIFTEQIEDATGDWVNRRNTLPLQTKDQ